MQNASNAQAVYNAFKTCKELYCASANCCMTAFDMRHVLQVSVEVNDAATHVIEYAFDFNNYTVDQFVNAVLHKLQSELDDTSPNFVVLTNIDTQDNHEVSCNAPLIDLSKVSQVIDALFYRIYVESVE